jgi:hypothetical protein
MKIAEKVYQSIKESYQNTGIDFEMFISKNKSRIKKLKIVISFSAWLLVYATTQTQTQTQNLKK